MSGTVFTTLESFGQVIYLLKVSTPSTVYLLHLLKRDKGKCIVNPFFNGNKEDGIDFPTSVIY